MAAGSVGLGGYGNLHQPAMNPDWTKGSVSTIDNPTGYNNHNRQFVTPGGQHQIDQILINGISAIDGILANDGVPAADGKRRNQQNKLKKQEASRDQLLSKKVQDGGEADSNNNNTRVEDTLSNDSLGYIDE